MNPFIFFIIFIASLFFIIPVLNFVVAGLSIKNIDNETIWCFYDYQNRVSINKNDRCFHLYKKLGDTEDLKILVKEPPVGQQRTVISEGAKDDNACERNYKELMPISENDSCLDAYITRAKLEMNSDNDFIEWMTKNPDLSPRKFSKSSFGSDNREILVARADTLKLLIERGIVKENNKSKSNNDSENSQESAVETKAENVSEDIQEPTLETKIEKLQEEIEALKQALNESEKEIKSLTDKK